MCRQLKTHSRIVLILINEVCLFDMGASLDYHKGWFASAEDQSSTTVNPVLYLRDLYERFGFHFDDIYAYDISQEETLDRIYQILPNKYHKAYR